MLQKTFILLIVLVFAISGCAPKMVQWSGQFYQAEHFNTPEEIDRHLKEKKVVLLSEISKAQKGERAIGTEALSRAVDLTLDVTYFGTVYLEKAITGISTASTIGFSTMSYFAALDILKLAADLKEKKNTVYAKIRFKNPVEYMRVRAVSDKEVSVNTIFAVMADSPDILKETEEHQKKCGWIFYFRPVHSKKEKIYGVHPESYHDKQSRDFSVVSDQLILVVRYQDQHKDLPEENLCSVKSAEMHLMKLVNIIAK